MLVCDIIHPHYFSFWGSSHLSFPFLSYSCSLSTPTLSLSRHQNRKELSAVLGVSEHHSFLKCNASLSVSVFID